MRPRVNSVLHRSCPMDAIRSAREGVSALQASALQQAGFRVYFAHIESTRGEKHVGGSFPAILRSLRLERGLNQYQVAAELHISQALLSHYENGLREPGLAFLAEAGAFYQVSTDYLLGLTPIRSALPRPEEPDPALRTLAETGADALTRILTALGETGDPESCRLAEEWLTVTLYDLLREYDKDGLCTLPPALSHTLARVCSGLARSRLLPGEPGAPDLQPTPELVERAEEILRRFWDEWREQA